MRLLPRRRVVSFIILAALLAVAPAPVPAQGASPAQLDELRAYIKQGWTTLRRSNRQLAESAADPKFRPQTDGRWPVYVSQLEKLDAVKDKLRAVVPPADFNEIVILQLPKEPGSITLPGLLYLPQAYVVPGGRFNEMYGWDSYFIQAGLIADSEVPLAKDVVDNFLYEVWNYGKVLNANRTYYLTRSQPPFLTEMILAVYRATNDRKWLEAAWPNVESYYRFWTTEPHLVKETGLSRYYDFGEGPAPEAIATERDPQGRTYYDLVRQYFRAHRVKDYDLSQYYDRKTDDLTPMFYQGDRSMRESGFDPSNRFGPFNIDIIHYNPVCLNSLLYLMERQGAEILTALDRGPEAAEWRKRAEDRARQINLLLWDERTGLYFDYDFQNRKIRRYPFLTTFYPLWAGIATPKQAARIVSNLPLFERAGGLQTSTHATGSQWDAPFGWAPLEMIAIQGLRKYSFDKDADRITAKFLSLVLQEFLRTRTVVEKYDVVRRTARVGSAIGFGNRSNEVGFGWTNAAFLELYRELPDDRKASVLNLTWPSHAR